MGKVEKMDDIRQNRKELQYTYSEYAKLEDGDPKKLDTADKLNLMFEEASVNYNNVMAMLPLAIEDIKNNFYTLFNTAEQIKKLFYGKVGALEVTVTSEQKGQRENTVLLDKWKLSFWKGNSLTVEKMIPEVMMNYFEI